MILKTGKTVDISTFKEGVVLMGILKIEFENIKGLKNVFLKLNVLNALVGINGTGKTQIQRAIKYFYDNLTQEAISKEMFDKENPYNDYLKITIKYSFNELLNRKEDVPDFLEEFIDKLDDDNQLSVTMIQFKNGNVVWSCTFEERKLIKYLFPVYFIDTRNINVTDWDSLWSLMGDLGQKRSSRENIFINELGKLLDNIYGNNIFATYKDLFKEIHDLGYGTEKFKNNEKFVQIQKILFEGESFNYNNKKLDYFSTGSNSFNYIKIFYLVLNRLHIEKLKEPLVIIDEPEIGLHPTYIDGLIKYILECTDSIQTIMSTHSPRTLKASIVNKGVAIFQISTNKSYTVVKKVKSLNNVKEKKIITDREASYYFSKGIIFVEGITEYELFTNSNLKGVYPILNEIEIFPYDSNNIILDVSHPKQRQMNIPHLLVLDMDKILTYNPEIKHFTLKKDTYNPLGNTELNKKENYYFNWLRILLKVRKRIKGISRKVVFSPNGRNFSMINETYNILVRLTQAYCAMYNVYPVQTTIEGAIVNFKNYEIFYKWIIQEETNYSDRDKLMSLYPTISDTNMKIEILRYIVGGKTDFLDFIEGNKINEFIQEDEVKTLYLDLIKLSKIGKSSGWVTEFLDYYFDNYNGKSNNFSSDFSELNDIMKIMGDIME